jgi:hypothetical protein
MSFPCGAREWNWLDSVSPTDTSRPLELDPMPDPLEYAQYGYGYGYYDYDAPIRWKNPWKPDESWRPDPSEIDFWEPDPMRSDHWRSDYWSRISEPVYEPPHSQVRFIDGLTRVSPIIRTLPNGGKFVSFTKPKKPVQSNRHGGGAKRNNIHGGLSNSGDRRQDKQPAPKYPFDLHLDGLGLDAEGIDKVQSAYAFAAYAQLEDELEDEPSANP